jgi:hypothetical protein
MPYIKGLDTYSALSLNRPMRIQTTLPTLGVNRYMVQSQINEKIAFCFKNNKAEDR